MVTHKEFNYLYDRGVIDVKIWGGVVGGVEKMIEAFEYGGKFFLRIHSIRAYVTKKRNNGKCYRMTNENHIIKEFAEREYANNYFKKAAEGLDRIG